MAERNTDTVPAMLTPGEFVVTKDAVDNAGGPGFFYWLMNALDPGSKKPSRNEYQHGGIVHSLLSRTQNKNNNYKDVAAELESVLPREELMEMAMPVGMARLIGKGGIRHMRDINTDDIKKALALLKETGKGGKKIAKDVQIDILLKQMFKEAPEFLPTKRPPIKKQKGGSVEDYSLMDYMMPTMDKRLGKPLMKFEHGGQVRQPGEPGYYHYMQELGQAGTTQAPPPGTTTPTPPAGTSGSYQDVTGTLTQAQGAGLSAGPLQGQLIQPSTSTSTGIASIFEEMGFKTPGEEYLSTVQAYDPTQQNRLREKLGKGMKRETTTFAGSGAERRDIEQQRDLLTEQYQMGAGDYRKQYREEVMAGVLDDLTQGTYDFEDLA